MKAVLAVGALAAAATWAALAMPSAAFDPVVFFEGRSTGEGTLHELLKGKRAVKVESAGRIAPGGVLILDQTVHIAGDAPKRRRWHLRADGAGWSGTLTDARGAVTARREGDGIRINYAMKGGLKVEQRLTPRAGGKVVDNAMTIRKFGLVVARLDEQIVKR